MKLTLICLFWIFTSGANANTIYNCESELSSNSGYNNTLKKYESSSNSEKGMKITFVVSKKGATIKGNGGHADLKKISDEAYLETTSAGNVFLWSVFPGKNDIPTTIFQQKAYEISPNPYQFTMTYKCD